MLSSITVASLIVIIFKSLTPVSASLSPYLGAADAVSLNLRHYTSSLPPPRNSGKMVRQLNPSKDDHEFQKQNSILARSPALLLLRTQHEYSLSRFP
jgi:hypothetical protein